MAKTIESILKDSFESDLPQALVDCVQVEQLIVSPVSYKDNIIEASAIVSLKLPDGSEWECDQVVRLRLKKR
jgi:hypothetical protein